MISDYVFVIKRRRKNVPKIFEEMQVKKTFVNFSFFFKVKTKTLIIQYGSFLL